MRLFFSALIFCFTYQLIAQGAWCVTKTYEDPAKKSMYENFLLQAGANQKIKPRVTLYLPVVIHVVAREGFQAVSMAQALHQIDVLNADFAALGDNISKLREEFKALVEDAGIHFCLATTDPTGQPTTGITFTPTNQFEIGQQYTQGRRSIHYDAYGGKSGWDPSRYINIWVGENGGILGTATLPGNADYEEEIGIVIDIRHFGSLGDAGYYNVFGRGHTLTHEMGHYLGLKHIWGEGMNENCDDSDDIDDTPNASGPHLGCPEDELISCGGSNMYQNFMDLTDDRCLAAFTHDQVARMHDVLDSFYPNLVAEMPCNNHLSDFDLWFDHLTWSMDDASNKIVVFNPAELVGKKVIRVFSMDGKLVFETDWRDNLTTMINLQDVASGVYLVHLDFGQSSGIRKIVIY